MNRLRAGLSRGVEDRFDRKVALRRSRWPDANGFVRLRDV
jgi:hypothetical protein